MTYDEIMALSGRELDAAVAEHIGGMAIHWRMLSGNKVPCYYAGTGQWWAVPSRTQFLAEALPIMDRILSAGELARNLFFAVLWPQAGLPIPHASEDLCRLMGSTQVQIVSRWIEDSFAWLLLADKLPQAICRAAVFVATQPGWESKEKGDADQC
jgi:hypothetical protein